MWRRRLAVKSAAPLKAKEGEVLEFVGRLNNKKGDLDALTKEGESFCERWFSVAVTTKTLKTPDFSERIWRECSELLLTFVHKTNTLSTRRTPWL